MENNTISWDQILTFAYIYEIKLLSNSLINMSGGEGVERETHTQRNKEFNNFSDSLFDYFNNIRHPLWNEIVVQSNIFASLIFVESGVKHHKPLSPSFMFWWHVIAILSRCGYLFVNLDSQFPWHLFFIKLDGSFWCKIVKYANMHYFTPFEV
jgi:hypothetical protein